MLELLDYSGDILSPHSGPDRPDLASQLAGFALGLMAGEQLDLSQRKPFGYVPVIVAVIIADQRRELL